MSLIIRLLDPTSHPSIAIPDVKTLVTLSHTLNYCRLRYEIIKRWKKRTRQTQNEVNRVRRYSLEKMFSERPEKLFTPCITKYQTQFTPNTLHHDLL